MINSLVRLLTEKSQTTQEIMDINKLTHKTQEIIQEGQTIASQLSNQSIEPGHVLKAIFNKDKDVIPYLLK